MPPVIVAQNLYKRYEGFPPVLRGVNITVEPGEMVAIMGPSGCGKSTMLHVLGMLHAPDAGSLEILGADVLAFNREQTAAFRRGNMGFIMQASNLFDHSTVFENVEFPLIYEQVPPQERWERVIRALELVRLSARVHYRSNRLSGGEQQRVAIARAMVNNPRILLADEPTGALDAKTSRLIMENFRNLCHTGGVALVMVTHDPKMAEYCDSIYTLEDGVLQCRRHEPPPLPPQDAHNLLQGPAPVVRGALVAARFPEAAGQGLMYAAHRLHAAGLLSRIYALSESGFLSSPEGYALPLAVRRMGRLRCLGAFAGMLRHMRDTSAQVWELWRQRPGRDGRGWWAQLQAFCAGALLARWGVQDGIQFFYAAEARGPSTASWVAARLMRAPFAFAVRARDLAAPGSDWAAMVHDAAFVRCDTEATRAALIGLLPEAEGKAIVLRDPLTLTPPEDDADMPVAGRRDVNLLAVGTLARRKGYDVLLRACALLRDRGLDFTLTLAGGGGAVMGLGRMSAQIVQLRKELALESRVNLPGLISHNDLPHILESHDIFAAPCIVHKSGRRDGIPNTVIEALAYGLPVVSTTVNALPEVVRDGETGLAVPPGDAPALAEALARLADDADLARRLARNGRCLAEEMFDPERNSRRLADIFITYYQKWRQSCAA